MELCLKVLKLKNFVVFRFVIMINNQNPSEIYLRCLIKLGLKPSETIIVEDSHYEGYLRKTLDICANKNLDDVTLII